MDIKKLENKNLNNISLVLIILAFGTLIFCFNSINIAIVSFVSILILSVLYGLSQKQNTKH